MTKLAEKFMKNVFLQLLIYPCRGQSMSPVNRHIIEFWDTKNTFQDLDEPDEYFYHSAKLCKVENCKNQ